MNEGRLNTDNERDSDWRHVKKLEVDVDVDINVTFTNPLEVVIRREHRLAAFNFVESKPRPIAKEEKTNA